MKVMTFNLRADNPLDMKNKWKYRRDFIYDIINQSNCDIIGLQEITNQMEQDLKENIVGYHQIGISRTKNFFMERNTVLVKKKYSIVEEKTFWLSKRPEKKGSAMWHSLFPRICTMVICQLDEQKIAIYNTHLDCLSPIARKKGLRIILNKIREQQEMEKMPCLLMGDFNAKPNSKVMQQFKAKGYGIDGLRPVQDIKPQLYKKATVGGFKGKEKGRHIDYIFASKEFDILDVEIARYNRAGRYPSDHYPVIAKLK